MNEVKDLGRREFLKLAIASAAATGLSHFQFLNFGGAGVAFAACEGGAADTCNSADPDVCDPADPQNPDICPDPNVASSDVCMPPDDEDECIPAQGEPDICDLQEGDTCVDPDPDICEWGPPPQIPDTCHPPDDPDICPDGVGGDGDICNPSDPQGSPDECIPGQQGDECGADPLDPDVPGPTAVEMASFSAGWTGGGVLLEWETASEVDSLGFNLYRSLAATSGYVKINADLIPCQSPGSATGAAYNYLDRQAPADTVCFYVVEAVDAFGNVDRYGPVQANPLRRLLPSRPRLSPGRPSMK